MQLELFRSHHWTYTWWVLAEHWYFVCDLQNSLRNVDYILFLSLFSSKCLSRNEHSQTLLEKVKMKLDKNLVYKLCINTKCLLLNIECMRSVVAQYRSLTQSVWMLYPLQSHDEIIS